MKLKVLLQVLACITLFGGTVHAQDNSDLAASSADMKKTEGADGWTKSLKFSGNGGLAIHKSHLSEVNGENYSIGGKLDGTLTWREGNREWRNSLLIDQSTAKLATSEHYIKGSDVLKIQSFYLWGLTNYPKVGPYAKGSYDTSLFRNHSYLTGPATVTDQNGVTSQKSDFRLGDGFGDNPQTLKASVGAFYKAYETKHANLVLSAGLGGMRVWASGLKATKDDATGAYTLTNLNSFTDYGLVLGLDLKGQFDAKTGYQVGFESLTPFDKGDDFDDDNLIALTNYEGFAKVDSKLYDWLSLGYEFRVIMQPKLQGKEQVSNLFGLSLTYVLL